MDLLERIEWQSSPQETRRDASPQRADHLAAIRSAFRRLTDSNPAYWDYTAVGNNGNPQAYFQYPAMMVPRMQGDIIDALRGVDPSLKRCFDPFAGSGTVLVEALKRGMDCMGTDVNPMSILLCRVKTAPFAGAKFTAALEQVFDMADRDRSLDLGIDYVNRVKWFTTDALIELSKLQRAILCQEPPEVRRLLWVAFAEAARLASNSRTTTYKLHIRTQDDIEARNKAVKQKVRDAMARVRDMYVGNERALGKEGLLQNGAFLGKAYIEHHDMRDRLRCRKADLLVSSPPYGDNHTTITYGQHSFLPLLWIPPQDIHDGLDDSLVKNTHAIDSASLGGLLKGALDREEEVREWSTNLTGLLDDPALPRDARVRLVAFFADLRESLKNGVDVLRPGAPIVLTLGNRSVAGKRVPTDNIVKDFLLGLGCEFIDAHPRAIPTKRMAHRNKSAGTMLSETMLVMRKRA
jgi:hypothetical protein